MTPLITAIVPTCHRDDLLAKCLRCLAPGAQTLAPENYEVIVTDDGSASTAQAMLKRDFPWARWVAGPRKGPAANRNSAAREADGEWLAFTDDDCVPDGGWLKAYVDEATKSPQIQVLEGRVRAERPCRTLAETSPLNDTGGYLWSCNFAIRRSIFLSLNGFDERFPIAAMEDVEFHTRLEKAGHASAFVREASVIHPWRPVHGWNDMKRRQEAFFLYLSIHPEKLSQFTFSGPIRSALRGIIKDTIPGMIRYRGAGIRERLVTHMAEIRADLLLLARSRGYRTHKFLLKKDAAFATK